MRILLAGGTGFIGGHILRVLLVAGHDVNVVARRLGPPLAGVTWVARDYARHQRKAFTLLSSPGTKSAFDLRTEPEAVRAEMRRVFRTMVQRARDEMKNTPLLPDPEDDPSDDEGPPETGGA